MNRTFADFSMKFMDRWSLLRVRTTRLSRLPMMPNTQITGATILLTSWSTTTWQLSAADMFPSRISGCGRAALSWSIVSTTSDNNSSHVVTSSPKPEVTWSMMDTFSGDQLRRRYSILLQATICRQWCLNALQSTVQVYMNADLN